MEPDADFDAQEGVFLIVDQNVLKGNASTSLNFQLLFNVWMKRMGQNVTIIVRDMDPGKVDALMEDVPKDVQENDM